jgi:hypothetical protein
MGEYLSAFDLPPETGQQIGLSPEDMIVDAEALAMLAAPCLADPSALTEAQFAAAKALLRGAVMRWSDTGTGVRQTEAAGTLSQTTDTTMSRRGMFWPSEITSLQAICSDGESGKAFAVDTISGSTIHAAICAASLGANWCSCGADLAGAPLWEQCE